MRNTSVTYSSYGLLSEGTEWVDAFHWSSPKFNDKKKTAVIHILGNVASEFILLIIFLEARSLQRECF